MREFYYLDERRLLEQLKKEWLNEGEPEDYVNHMLDQIEEFTKLYSNPKVSIYNIEMVPDGYVEIYLSSYYMIRINPDNYELVVRNKYLNEKKGNKG